MPALVQALQSLLWEASALQLGARPANTTSEADERCFSTIAGSATVDVYSTELSGRSRWRSSIANFCCFGIGLPNRPRHLALYNSDVRADAKGSGFCVLD